VRDLAEIHAKALVKEEAAGQRFIITAGPYEWQQFRMPPLSFFISIFFLEYLTNLWTVNAVDGVPIAKTVYTSVNRFDTSKSKRVFGMMYKTLEETAKDSVDEFNKRGW
jgi:hypothetical protein